MAPSTRGGYSFSNSRLSYGADRLVSLKESTDVWLDPEGTISLEISGQLRVVVVACLICCGVSPCPKPQPTIVSHDGGAPTDHARVCLAVPPTVSATLPDVVD